MVAARAPPVVVAIDGASAAGKSTIVARTAKALGWVPLAEAYDRLVPPPDLRFSDDRDLRTLERTLLDEESRRWSSARELRSQGWTVIADTDFLGPLTYTEGLVALGRASPGVLRDLVRRARQLARRRAWGMPDALVYLTTSASLRRDRAARDPGRHPPDLAARHEIVGEVEERFYRELLPAAFPGRVRWLNGDRPPERLVGEIRRFCRGIRPLGGADRVAQRVLDLVERPSPAGAPDGRRAGSAMVKKPALSPRAPRG